jgi:hypothetical protein
MRGYACLMSDFRAHRYNVLVLQQMSYGPPAGIHTESIDRYCTQHDDSLLTAAVHQPNTLTSSAACFGLVAHTGLDPAKLRLVKRISFAD